MRVVRGTRRRPCLCPSRTRTSNGRSFVRSMRRPVFAAGIPDPDAVPIVFNHATKLDQSSSSEKTIMAKRKTTLKKNWVKGLLEWNEVLNNTKTGLHGDHTIHVTVTTTQADCGQGFHL